MAIPSKAERERRADQIRRFVVADRRRDRIGRRPQMMYEVVKPAHDYYKPGGYLHDPGAYVETPQITESPDLRDGEGLD